MMESDMNPTYSLTKQPRNKKELEKKKRGEKWKGTWYVRYRLPDGKWTPLRSTGCASKADAIEKVEGQKPKVGKVTRLDEYASGFFDWPESRYVTDRRAGGHRVSYRSAQDNRLHYQNHVKRILGNPRLRDIDRVMTRRLRDTLFKEGKAANTINHVVNCLSILLDAAAEDGIISEVPRMYRAGGNAKKRGVLTVEEARIVLASEHWRDERERIASVLAATTGLRQGEILGLTRDRVHREYIDVSQVWDRSSWRLKPTTKNGEARVVPISKRIRRELARLIASTPHRPRWFVFYHNVSMIAPYPAEDITAGLYHVLRAEGISDAVRKDAGITFHSWRHYANSRLIDAGVPAETVRALIGHRSEGMTMNYYRPGEVAKIIDVQDK